MATEWYYSKDEQRFGPVSIKELRELSSSGDIEPSDLVWKEGMSDWVPATKVKGLFGESGGGRKATSEPPATDWYFTTNGQQQGPVAVEQLRRLIAPSDLVWSEGLPEWVPASTIPNLLHNQRTSPSLASDASSSGSRRSPKSGNVARYCRNCGKQVGKETIVCMTCGSSPETGNEFCPGCGNETNPNAVICLKCGIGLQATKSRTVSKLAPKETADADLVFPSDPPKDPILMGVLSFFIAWLGQLVIGQVTKGIVMFLLTPFLFALFFIATLGMGLVILPFLNLIAAIDAYLLAKKLKEGREIGKWEFFGIETAPSLAMLTLPSKRTARNGVPAAVTKPRPPGLVGSAIGMLFVSGLAMMISLLGVIGIVINSHNLPALMQIFTALSFIHNAWVIFAIVQTMKMQRYAFAITAPLLVMGSWLWLTFSGVPIGMSVMGMLGGISVGLWSLGVLRQPEVRAAFANQYDPLETLLPMAKATIEGQSPNWIAIKGLFTQMMSNKIGLAIAGGILLFLLAVPLLSLLPPEIKSKYLGMLPGQSVNSPLAEKLVGVWRVSKGSRPGTVEFTKGGSALYTWHHTDLDEERTTAGKYVFVKDNVVEIHEGSLKVQFRIEFTSDEEVVFTKDSGGTLVFSDLAGRLTLKTPSSGSSSDREKLMKAIAEGDNLWDAALQGIKDAKKIKDTSEQLRASSEAKKKADEAFEKYMVVVNSQHDLSDRDVLSRVYGRVIDVALDRKNNPALAKEVAIKSLRQDVLPSTSSEKASAVLDAAKKTIKSEGR